MKSHTYWVSALLVLALALWCTLGVSAEDTTTTASGTAGSFQLEQVYVNAPELDVYFYATDANGESYSPIVVQAQGVEATLGDRKLDTGMIGVADDPICYIIALDNSTSIDAEDFHKMRTAIWKLAQTKQDKDQIMVYTLAGGAQCALPATNDKAEIFNTLRTIGQSEGAIDLTGTVTMLAADIQTEYQSLAPRKVAFVCTDAAQIMTNLALLGGTLGTDQSNLNMAMYTFICTAAPDQLESTTQMSGGKVIACRHADLAAEMQAKQTKFAQALTLRTEVPDSLTGERQEIFTLSVPKLGSAVKSSTTVYMGFKMEKPQVTKVEPLGRTKLRLTFNQAVNANADRPQYYRVYTNDVWGWYVKIESVQLSEDGRTAVLTTEPLYQGRYNVTLNKVASRMTPANVSARQQSCSFMIGSIASVRLKEAQVKELLTKKKTEVISGFVAKTGMKFDAPLKLTEEGEIAFDFPEKPRPEETTVPCPKCGKMLMKTQWRYECACGFKIWHTVAKVELSEEVMKELLTTGKTKQKIAGFTSKAGNTFDTCLKYENDQISFDFDNPGEAPPKEAAAAEETTALKETEESERKTISNHEN